MTIQRIDRAFRTILTRAVIEDLKFHDLRYAFARCLVMKGASPKDLQELFGHKTLSMTTRYTHLSQEHKKKAVNLLNGLTASKKPSDTMCHKTVTFSTPKKSHLR